MDVLAIAAGKGGVGKSMLTLNLALACKEQGFRVGVLDCDLYGPSIPTMIQEQTPPSKHNEMILPAKGFGISYLSIAHLHQGPALMRAPIARAFLSTFQNKVAWGDLDLLFLDFPPGTGDIPLTLCQEMGVKGALLVTTPQWVALQDVSRAAQMFLQMSIPLLGVVENMSFLVNMPEHKPFGEGGGKKLADAFQIPLFGQIPLDPKIASCSDKGISLFSIGAGAPFISIAEQLLERMKRQVSQTLEVFEQKEEGLYLRFSDGKEGVIPPFKLQKECPCVRCREAKESGFATYGEKNVTLRQISKVGSYAFACQFSSGCSQGIYPFLLIKQLL